MKQFTRPLRWTVPTAQYVGLKLAASSDRTKANLADRTLGRIRRTASFDEAKRVMSGQEDFTRRRGDAERLLQRGREYYVMEKMLRSIAPVLRRYGRENCVAERMTLPSIASVLRR